MKIGEYEQMMAYLKKPKRLFTSKSQDTIGGGNIQGDDLGSRIGLAGPELVKRGENRDKYRVKYRDPELGKDKRGYTKENKKFFETKKEAQKFYDDRQKRMGELTSSGPIDIKTKQTEQINNFVNDFIDKNIKSYGVKDYDQFKKDMLKEFKRSGIKDASGRSALSGDLPNIGTQESRAGFTKFGLDPAYRQKVNKDLGITSDIQNHFKKIFYSGVFENNPDLVNKMSRYLDYQNIDKKFYGGNINKVDRAALLKEYADVVNPEFETDFIYMMDEMENPKLRGTVFKKYFGNKYDKFIDKRNASMKQYLDAVKIIENKLGPKKLKEALGTTSIKKFMDKQTELLNKIFDTSVFTGPDRGLIFAGDHLEGIAEIARYKNKDDIIRGLQNVAGTTVARNRELGWKRLSKPRRDLINKIQKGINVDANVEELNRITKLSYPDFKGDEFYKYDPKTKNVVPTENFTVKYSPEEGFKRYFTELATTEKGTEQIVRQAAENPQLQKFLTEIEGGNFENLPKVIQKYRQNKINFGKNLNYYCGIAGRTKAATGILPGATCSADDIVQGMKIDSQTPAGKKRLASVAKNFGKVFGKIIAPIDIGIEGAFAMPHLLRGDVEGAIGATTAGLFGAGKDAMEQVGEKFGTDSTEYALYGREQALQNKILAMGEMDKLFSQSEQLGIIPSEEGVTQKPIGGERQREAATKEFTNKFRNIAGIDKQATEEFEKYYPSTTDIMKNTEAFKNIRSYSDEIQQRGILKPSDPTTLKGFLETGGGRSQYPILPRFDLPMLQEQARDYTGMDYLDRTAAMPTGVAAQVPAFEKEQVQQGIKEYAMKYGPRAAKQFFEQQGIETESALKGMAPTLFMNEEAKLNFSNGGRLTLYTGGRVGFADGPEDPSKRKTLKKIGIGGGIAGGLMTGLINVMDLFKGAKTGIAATKAAESEAQKVFFDLVNAVKNKGIMNKLDDLLETKVGVKYEYKGVEVLEDGENIELRFNTDKGAPAVVEYRKPGYDVDPEAGTSYKVPGEFIAEGQEVGRYGKSGDVDIDFEDEIIDTFEDTKKIIDD
jgi:hypothetical protein